MKLNRDKLRAITHYTTSYDYEDIPVEGNASAIDPETDKETEAWIKDQLDYGNLFAWCRVKVSAHALGHEGVDHLGACSYESKDAIERDLIPEMKENAFDDLCGIIERVLEQIPGILED